MSDPKPKPDAEAERIVSVAVRLPGPREPSKKIVEEAAAELQETAAKLGG
jgi:hypothetical protein